MVHALPFRVVPLQMLTTPHPLPGGYRGARPTRLATQGGVDTVDARRRRCTLPHGREISPRSYSARSAYDRLQRLRGGYLLGEDMVRRPVRTRCVDIPLLGVYPSGAVNTPVYSVGTVDGARGHLRVSRGAGEPPTPHRTVYRGSSSRCPLAPQQRHGLPHTDSPPAALRIPATDPLTCGLAPPLAEAPGDDLPVERPLSRLLAPAGV